MKLKQKIRHPRLVFVILMIALFAVFLLYYFFVFSGMFARNQFTNEMVEISEQKEKSIFSVQKLLLYSSASAIDNSEDKSLSDLSICQYSDLSIYIDNLATISELTDENTVKELYIDNIVITSAADRGNKLLNYKNPLDFGKFKMLKSPENNRIDYTIVNTNSQNETHDYSQPTFYTDCSNPITLGFVNKDILTNYAVSQDSSTVSFNGKVLKEANIPIEDINYTLNFTIHIVNNLNEEFSYNMKLDVDLNDDNGGIYNGYVYKGKSTSGSQYNFFKN